MANTKSALKRVQISERNRLRNKAYKSAVRTLIKKCLVAVSSYGANPSPEGLESAQQALSEAYSKIDKAVKRNVLHRNNGARKKASLAKALQKVSQAS
ncbi:MULTISPECIES: 30S ribosomal protein S20 [Microcystis]|uniref:Small ribosomal subunit protein bS20 n=5 Tax=Microcystis TaxID=1125 RepID=A0A841UI31_MICAE|nr:MULTISPECIES: 30S ribosomal protein S20 [Microcystis]MCA2553930.1 30S ribosomal protein S20 [Microcystis sp. M04BS1]MCZ8189151.1 30S ribosomal protein S20 [Microcystis sp. LE19-338.1B]MCZ8360100.1 30S ribosomal protein S20 [Microcystis sp. LE19-388.1G]NCS23905.1 30S ribosomal protein S20 [Microcystis aeruginosa BS13-02]TRU19296.1 MAG: 30S ribosomal protein S20 [Microcystis aeruginosa Ma_MB_S_20031200_S102D]TRU33225.1 MAG: 30S ribosomal protein S20 [Microcystis aeruginosa Ma_MB_S_20031200_S